MFNKNKPLDNSTSSGLGIPTPPEPAKPTPAAAPISAAPARAPEPARSAARSSSLSTLSAGVKYEGNISGAGELQVDGSLKGDIRVVRVVIGEGGAVEGTVHADILEVRGRVSGAIVAKQVKLFATSRVEGDITQEQLSIEQGAWFQGRCTQAKRDTPGANMLESPTPAEKPAPAKTDAKVEAKPAA
ncbi:MAG: polymer-forming cytoskeletal protein [Brevundimonas diminuta]|jgi:cytoskeletal protein CcmA (bactofilin family)|uniref:bactofilin family protein n=1 Tax=Brevundimonas diminuta TaxID=293 RepID=UPI00289AA80C|nr:polymer-forming cytoskeletal protein [Brevundimonas diminuta]MBI2248990.1 polymer-forming cytoskeletal protein [Brevundimonas diminuta]